MGVRSYFKNTVKANTDIKSWTGWSLVKGNANYVKTLIADIKSPKESVPQIPEKRTFEEVMQDNGLTEKDLKTRKYNYFIVSIFCACFTVGALYWTFHLVMKGMIMSGIVSLSVAFLMGTYAATQNFYYYCIQQRKLTCTFREWLLHFFRK